MSHTVFIIGAGASVSEAQRFRPKQERDHPPLDRTFFRRVKGHGERRLLQRVVDHAERLGQPDLFSDDPPVSLEEHLGRLYFDMRNSRSDATRTAYFDLVRLYASELLTTTNWLIGRSGWFRRVLTAEIEAGHRTTVLTFNHDLLIEGALSTLRRYRDAWCLEHVYGFSPRLEQIATTAPQFESDCPGARSDHVEVLKLHGSMNWVFRTRSAYPPRDVTSRQRELYLWNNIRLPPGAQQMRGATRLWHLWPLIVPPVYEKHGFIRNELEKVWARADAALQDADRVVFWGYSFPRADLHARYFFESAAYGNAALRRALLINPDSNAEREMWSILRSRSIEHHRDVEDYLAA